jgi:hypothetical protein
MYIHEYKPPLHIRGVAKSFRHSSGACRLGDGGLWFVFPWVFAFLLDQSRKRLPENPFAYSQSDDLDMAQDCEFKETQNFGYTVWQTMQFGGPIL